MFGFPVANLVHRRARGERATGLGIGNQHAPLGAQERRGLGHEVHAAEHDQGALARRRLLRKLQRIADVVGEILDDRNLVVVREDECVVLPSQIFDAPEELVF